MSDIQVESVQSDLRSEMISSTLRHSELFDHFERRDTVIVQVVTSRNKQELQDAQLGAKIFGELARGQKRLLLVDMRLPFSTGPGVREYYASAEANQFVKGMALLIGSDTGRIIGNFFLRINQPPSPCRMFTDPRMALAWLKSLK